MYQPVRQKGKIIHIFFLFSLKNDSQPFKGMKLFKGIILKDRLKTNCN